MEIKDFRLHFRSTFPDLMGSRILVALSGGADSVALLQLLHRTADDLKIQVGAAHVHHGTRGAEADHDAAFCRTLCERLEIPMSILHVRPETSPSDGREAAWRRARYALLRDEAQRLDVSTIATAHHRDDVAEGVLVQLVRGAGPRAMAGILERGPHLIRPLLPWSREELRVWLEEEDILWREDSSNTSPRHLRNRIRHEVLPQLEESFPALRRHLIHLASALAKDDAFIATELAARNLQIDPWHPQGGIPFADIRSLPEALRIRWLHAMTAKTAVGRATRRQAEHLGDLLTGRRTAVTLAGRWSLRLAAGRLWLEPPFPPAPFEIVLKPNETVDLPVPGWAVTVGRASPSSLVAGDWSFPVANDVPIVVRSPRPGDHLPDGRSIRSLYRRHLPRHLRNSWPLFVIGDKILWVPGIGIDAETMNGIWRVEVTRR